MCVRADANECCAAGLPPCNPPGGTPAGPPAFYESQKGGGLGDTSPKRVRAAARSRSDLPTPI